MIHTGGHSFGHCIITIESEGQKAVHMADIFPTLAHRNPLWVTAYDDYPMTSIQEKKDVFRIIFLMIIGSCFIMTRTTLHLNLNLISTILKKQLNVHIDYTKSMRKVIALFKNLNIFE